MCGKEMGWEGSNEVGMEGGGVAEGYSVVEMKGGGCGGLEGLSLSVGASGAGVDSDASFGEGSMLSAEGVSVGVCPSLSRGCASSAGFSSPGFAGAVTGPSQPSWSPLIYSFHV